MSDVDEAALRESGWFITRHAREAAERRGVSLREVIAIIERADVTYDQSNYGAGRQIRQRGNLALAVNVPDRVVITILLRTSAEWSDADCRSRT